MSSKEAARKAYDRKFDLVFIDGAHDYASVNANIKEWIDHVMLGGWIGGHDYNDERIGLREAVDGHFGKDKVLTGCDSTWWVRL